MNYFFFYLEIFRITENKCTHTHKQDRTKKHRGEKDSMFALAGDY